MTLHQLKILLAVAKHQSVTEAAKEMHISQPSVSQQLRLLEEECRAKLYKRTAHGIDLTEAGRKLWSLGFFFAFEHRAF